jgi:mRNA-degrading endonuclease RelE of RelBE toxin-antitoxin system
VSWRIFATATADPDFARLSDSERAALNEDLFLWVENGPPRANKHTVLDVEIFEDVVPSGYRIDYFVNEAEPYVAILRIRAV